MSDESNSSAPVSSESTGSESSWETEDQEAEDDSDLFEDVKIARAEARKAEAEKKAKTAEVKPKAEAKPAEPKAPKKFHKTTINGREETVDEETLIREYQKSRAGDDRLQKASQMEKQVQHLMQTLKENPSAILNDPRLGINRQQLAESILREQIEAELEDPKDREAKTLKERLAAYEEREEREKQSAKEQQAQAERKEAVGKAQARLSDTFEKAMEQSVLSKDPETKAATLRDMALYYRMTRAQGHEATPAELAAHVEQKQMKGFHSAANTLSGEELVSFLGKDVLKKIREYDLGRLEQRHSKPNTQANENWAPRNQVTKEPQYIDPNDFRDRIRGNK